MTTKAKATRESVRRTAVEVLRKRFLTLARLRYEVRAACPHDATADDGVFQEACWAAWDYAEAAVKEMKRRCRQRSKRTTA
ncbi:MAG: hypothetical protein K8U57_34045 [Planctomycetes bacterium]|nr:hypothetical protein [Planctomycetota bacterium]